MLSRIFNKALNRLEKILMTFLDDFRAALANIPQGGTGDQAQIDALKSAVTDLGNKLANNNAGDAANTQLIADLETAVSELVAKLTVSAPTPVLAPETPPA